MFAHVSIKLNIIFECSLNSSFSETLLINETPYAIYKGLKRQPLTRRGKKKQPSATI